MTTALPPGPPSPVASAILALLASPSDKGRWAPEAAAELAEAHGVTEVEVWRELAALSPELLPPAAARYESEQVHAFLRDRCVARQDFAGAASAQRYLDKLRGVTPAGSASKKEEGPAALPSAPSPALAFDGPTCWMLVGPPCAGKSTWARAHIAGAKRSTVVLSVDDHVEARARAEGLTYAAAVKRYAGEGERLLLDALRAALARGDDIVWDRTNHTAKSRAERLALLPASYRRVAVVCAADPYELRRRITERRKTTGKDLLPVALAAALKAYEPPTPEEGFAEILDGAALPSAPALPRSALLAVLRAVLALGTAPGKPGREAVSAALGALEAWPDLRAAVLDAVAELTR